MAIEFRDVSFAYGSLTVLDHFSLTLPEKGVLCLTGPSGCGKTTLLRLLAGLEKPAAGIIAGWDGRRAAVVFQEDRLLPWMTAEDNVAAALPGSQEAARRRARSCLEAVQLGGQARRLPAELSGGMRRRVAIARALAADADLLLLDEPFTGLDPHLWAGIAAVLRQAYAGRPILLVTHHPAEAEAMGAEILPLEGPPLRKQ